MEPHALVINLERAKERLSFQTRQLASLGVSFDRIDAIDAVSIPESDYRSIMYQSERPLARNEIACMMSHRLAWRRIVAQNRPMLVLEDDALLSLNLASFLRALSPPTDSAIAYNLETSTARKLVARHPAGEPIAGHWLKRTFYDRGGAGAYVLTPRAAALAIAQTERAAGKADSVLNHLAGVTRLQVEPALSMQLQSIEELQACTASETRLASQSTNARPPSAETRLAIWLLHPQMKLRRLKTNAAKILAKVSNPLAAHGRVIPRCPTIESQIGHLAA